MADDSSARWILFYFRDKKTSYLHMKQFIRKPLRKAFYVNYEKQYKYLLNIIPSLNGKDFVSQSCKKCN